MLTLAFTPFPVLVTKSLTLRQLSVNDDKEIFALRSNKQANKYMDRPPCNTIKDAVNFIEKITEVVNNNIGIYWAITLTANDSVVGAICLFNFSNENNQAEIGYELLPAFQKQGLMQEAISKVIAYGRDVVGLKTIVATSHLENKNSSKLLTKNNFRQQENSNTNADKMLGFFKLSFSE